MKAGSDYEPRIYVACLSSYNAGALHGTWISIDENSDEDSINEQMKALPDTLKHNIDWEGVARDLDLGGDIWDARTSDGNVAIFINS